MDARSRALLLLLTVCALALVGAQAASAATFTVASTADAVAADPASGCATSTSSAAGGACTLRSSVQAADATAGASTITIPAGTYNLTIPQTQPRVDDGTIGNLVITDSGGATDITLAGAGAATTIVDGGGKAGALQDRLLNILGRPTVHISGLTFRNGYLVNTNGGVDYEPGGGISARDTATVNIDQSVITQNTSAAPGSGDGGGVAESFNIFLFDRRTAASHAAAQARQNVTYNITNTTISANVAKNGGGGASGSAGGTFNFTADTFVGNSATNSGGAYADSGGDTDNFLNDTIVQNTSGNSGGGIFEGYGTGQLTNDTVNNNTATNDSGNLGIGEAGSLSFNNSIITGGAPNNCSLPGGPDHGYNLYDDSGSGCSGGTPPSTDVTGANPKLGPLQDNGGPTFTEALQPGSPAIDQIPQASCIDFNQNPVPVDQRGVPRPQPPGGRCDIGAFEAAAADLSITASGTPSPDPVGHPATFTFTINNSGPGPATGVTFTDTLPGGATLASATPSQGHCSGSTTITCQLGVVPDGTATVTLALTPSTAGTLTTTASVSGNEPDPTSADNSATASVSVVAPAGQTQASTQKHVAPPPPPPVIVCASLRHFYIHIQHVNLLRVASATVHFHGHDVRVLRTVRLHSFIDLRRFPPGTYVVHIVAVTRHGKHLKGRRTYHTCHTRLPGHKYLFL